jgi:hypothetical protein
LIKDDRPIRCTSEVICFGARESKYDYPNSSKTKVTRTFV